MSFKVQMLQLKKTLLILLALTLCLVLGYLFSFQMMANGECVKGDCENGWGEKRYFVGSQKYHIYDGQFVNGKEEGQGKFTDANGTVFVGFWKDGKRNGYGKYISTNLETYEGYFSENFQHGKGEFTWSDSTKLFVNWVKGEPQGEGTLVLPDKSQHTGTYQNGVIYEGSGIYIYDDGSRYLGEWKDGKRHGKGQLTDPTGKIIQKGIWKQDVFVGE